MQLSHVLDTVANLYRLKVIADGSRVYARIGDFEPQIWALTSRSACVYYLRTNKPGCVRITQDRVRWAPTVDGSQNDAQLEVLMSDLPSEKAQRFTLVIEHCDPEREVAVIEKSSRRQNSDGVYQSEDTGVNVIDAVGYRGATLMWKDKDGVEGFVETPEASSFYPNIREYESAHATVYGTQYMSQFMTAAEAQRLSKNSDQYLIKLTRSDMHTLVKNSTGGMNKLSQEIMKRFHERG